MNEIISNWKERQVIDGAHTHISPLYLRAASACSSEPPLAVARFEVVDELVNSLRIARGREVAGTRVITVLLESTTCATEALTIAARSHLLLIILGEERITLLAIAMHVSVALTDLIRSATALIATGATTTIVTATIVEVLRDRRLLETMLVARHLPAHVVVVYRARTPIFALLTASPG